MSVACNGLAISCYPCQTWLAFARETPKSSGYRSSATWWNFSSSLPLSFLAVWIHLCFEPNSSRLSCVAEGCRWLCFYCKSLIIHLASPWMFSLSKGYWLVETTMQRQERKLGIYWAKLAQALILETDAFPRFVIFLDQTSSGIEASSEWVGEHCSVRYRWDLPERF